MSEVSFLKDLSFVWLAALISGFIFRHLKQPMITGYIFAGFLIGPYCLQLIDSQDHVHDLAELGVALLLFTLGVELSLKQIFSANKKVILVGVSQVVLTIFFGFFGSQALGLTSSLAGALLFGSICALSSTVVVTKILGERGELSSLHGSILIGVLIIQDLALVPIISLLTALNSDAGGIVSSLLLAALKAVVLIGLVIFGATQVVPRFLGKAAATGSRELFQLAVMSICLVTAVLSKQLGMSVELGAFLAGIMVSESIYGYQALADVHPMKDLFSTIFFVTVGMMLNPLYVTNNLSFILLFVLALMLVKILIASLSARIAVKTNRTALLVGLGLAQIGEFSFVLATLGQSLKIIENDLYDLYISASVLTLLLSPFIISMAPRLLNKLSGEDAGDEVGAKLKQTSVDLHDHVVLCGFGVSGHGLARVLSEYSIPFVVVELNAGLLEELDAGGYRYVYGDACKDVILKSASIDRARALVVSVHDHISAVNIIGTALALNPELRVVAKAVDPNQIESLKEVGANAVVSPEFETGMELTKQTLLGLEVDLPDIKNALDDFETRRYSEFSPEGEQIEELSPSPHVDNLTVWLRVNESELDGRSIADIEFRNRTGCTIVAVKRGDERTNYPDPEFVLHRGDELCLVGRYEQIVLAEATLDVARFTPLSKA